MYKNVQIFDKNKNDINIFYLNTLSNHLNKKFIINLSKTDLNIVIEIYNKNNKNNQITSLEDIKKNKI